MNKKLSALFMVLVMVLSMVPLAFADDATGAEDDVVAISLDAVAAVEVEDADELDDYTEDEVEVELESEEEEEMAEYVDEDIPSGTSVDACVDRVGRIHPRASEDRVTKICRWRLWLKEHPAVRQEIRREVRHQVAEKIQDRRVDLVDDRPVRLVAAKRIVAKDRIVMARQNYVIAKENYLIAKKAYLDLKPKFIEAKQKFRDCVGDDSEECQETRAELKKDAKPFLLHAADVVLETLNRVYNKVESSEELDEDEAEEIIADLADSIAEIEDAKETVENLDEDATSDDIKEAASTIREAWREMKHRLKMHVGHLLNAKIGNVLQRADHLGDRFENILEKLEEDGKDTSDIEDLVDEYQDYVDEAIADYGSAKEKFKEAKDAEDMDDLVQEAHRYMKSANENLKSARALVRDIVSEIKATNSGSLDVEESEEVEEESEDEDVEEEDETEGESEDEDVEEEDETETEDDSDDGSDTETEDGSDVESDVEEEIAKYRPDYTPGEDLGYFIWQGPRNIWTICASGDGTGHRLKGKITADDGFCRTKPYLYERGQDRYRLGAEEIRFRAWVGPHQDCLRFATLSEEVSFELYMDGESADFVYFGPDKENVGSPADIEGEAFPECQADVSVESGYELAEDDYDEELTEDEIAVEEEVSDELDEVLAEEVEEASEEA